jgi:hypothetical protein
VPVLLAALQAGCGEDEPKVRLRITAYAEVPGQVDRIVVKVSAAREARGGFCGPVENTFLLESAADLPIDVDCTKGATYGYAAVFRVEWRQGIRALNVRDFTVVFPAAGTQLRLAELDEPCRILGPCPEGQQCEDGVCADRPFLPPFDDPGSVDAGGPCDTTAGGE